MDDFISYYWAPETLEDTSLNQAFQKLIDSESTTKEKLFAFETLIENDSVIAKSIAFDHFFYNESITRHGKENPFLYYKDKLIENARNILKGQSITSITPTGEQIFGANYASALGILVHFSEEKDIELIRPILLNSSDIAVLFAGFMAVGRCLSTIKKYDLQIITSITRIIHEDQWPEQLKVMAINALRDYETPEVEEFLVEVSKTCTLPISAYAAKILGSRNLARYRDLLQELVDSWPEDARYPASEIRTLLESDSTD